MKTKSLTISHAEKELELVGYNDGDEMNTMMKKDVMELLEVFSKQGHSGFSAPICVQLFEKLALHKPLKPIMCTPDEWGEVTPNGDTKIFQNVRLSSVFKEGEDGRPYYLDAIIWKTQSGGTWAGSAFTVEGKQINSRQFINIPFNPKTFYIDVIEEEIVKDDWKFTIKDEEQLLQVFEYYQR